MLVAGLLVGLQLVVLVRAESAALPLLWQGRQWLSGPHQPDVAYLPIAAARSLGGLEPSIPRQARVLLVTPSPFVLPYDFYFAPRPLTVLMRVDPTLIERTATRLPATARQAERWLEQILERRQQLTAERLAEELPRADYVVTFLAEAGQVGLLVPGLMPPGARLEPVDRTEQAALYQLVRP